MNLARIVRSLSSDLQAKPCPASAPIQETVTGIWFLLESVRTVTLRSWHTITLIPATPTRTATASGRVITSF